MDVREELKFCAYSKKNGGGSGRGRGRVGRVGGRVGGFGEDVK